MAELRKRKIDALKLALSFAFATKHYLRGEDGVHWDDYTDLPTSFGRYDEQSSGTMTPPSYLARRDVLKDGDNTSGRNSPDTDQRRADATKRVLPKRSKVAASGAMTPLLGASRIDMSGSDTLSIPLPLMSVNVLPGRCVRMTSHHERRSA